MNEELIKVLRTVIKEEIEPIKEQIGSLEQRIGGLEQGFESVDEHIGSLEQRFDSLEQRFDSIDERIGNIEQDVKELKSGQERLQKNIIQHLGNYTDRITQHVDDQNAALNKRVFVLETEIHRLFRQS